MADAIIGAALSIKMLHVIKHFKLTSQNISSIPENDGRKQIYEHNCFEFIVRSKNNHDVAETIFFKLIMF